MGLFSGSTDNPNTQATIQWGTQISSSLMQILQAGDIVPGSDPSYATCKTIYLYHPLGAKIAEGPVSIAQSQERQISIPDSPEKDLIDAFTREWRTIGKIGADTLIHNTMKTARIYGISALVLGAEGDKSSEPLDIGDLAGKEIFFNVLDPLNTAGSLVLNQDPNAPDFQKPRELRVSGQPYHPSRACVIMNEQPVYIAFTSASFGFVGRSSYQRAFYPLKSYIQTMITDDVVTTKAALLVAKLKSPSSITDARTHYFWQFKRDAIKAAQTGNVLSIGTDEDLQSVDLKNLREAAEFARNNILKNIATGADMPAVMLDQETFARGMAEGTEDAKVVSQFIDRLRLQMQPIYAYMDEIVMHRAWSPEFYKSIQSKFPEYKDTSYEDAFYSWKNSFTATWPNLLVEPDSKLIERDAKILESAIGIYEVLVPKLDQPNVARAAAWLADVVNSRKQLVASPLDLDYDTLAEYQPPAGESGKEPETRATYDV